MTSTTEVTMDKDLAHDQIVVTAHFTAKPELVWQAWTTRETLDKWWAPKPWHAETKKLELKEGGSWVYDMVGPEGQRQHCTMAYAKISSPKSFEATDSFTDAKGNVDKSFPQTRWTCEFNPSGTGTEARITILPLTEGALKKNLEMGFEAGFKSALGNLEQYFEERR